MSYAMSRTVVLFLLCLTAVISTKNTKPKWPKSKRQDPAESPHFKQEILNLMGLQKRPRPTISSSLRRVMSAPRYMMKLYNSITKNQSYADGFCCNNTLADSRALGADTIMSYLHPVHGQASKLSHHHATFHFKITNPEGEKITATEFRLYKQRTPPSKFWQNSAYVVRLYQIISPAEVLDLLETRVLRSWDVGWQAFDITQAGKTWLESPSNNYGLELAVENWFNHEVSPFEAGFVGFHGPKEFHPFILSFFQTDKGHASRRFDSVLLHQKSRRPPRSLDIEFPSSILSKRTKPQTICQRHPLYVDFEKLMWHDWIYAPVGFSAYYCAGECSFPLTSHMNATRHAIIQTLVSVVSTRQDVPKACCAPTELKPISVLYSDDDRVTLKHYSNMVVTSCGCQ